MAEDAAAVEFREALVNELRTTGRITSGAVEAAFRTVPRHEFALPGTPLEEVYAVDNPMATKRNAQGLTVSSISSTYIQARMIEQAQLRPGANVLEVGTGLYRVRSVVQG